MFFVTLSKVIVTVSKRFVTLSKVIVTYVNVLCKTRDFLWIAIRMFMDGEMVYWIAPIVVEILAEIETDSGNMVCWNRRKFRSKMIWVVFGSCWLGVFPLPFTGLTISYHYPTLVFVPLKKYNVTLLLWKEKQPPYGTVQVKKAKVI